MTATLNINLTTEQFIMMFQQFSKREQQKIVEKISYITNDKPRKLSLEESAALLLYDYENDKELTIFSTLDGEDFYETK